ncbi:MAG: hypothetical protein GX995_09645 [Clostridiales bacterium]|jgi:hypothetical protein|nr:hypothetical protein [Clostridiales bacterium]
MISWSNKLFLSEKFKTRDLSKIKSNINEGKLTRNVYCITFASNPKNLFDIYNAKEFIQPFYKKQDLHILGLAENKNKAYELVKDMLEEVYERTGDFKVREYFS